MNNKEIIKNLRSGKSSTILETLKFVIEEGNNEILVEVIDLIQNAKDDEVRDTAINIIENLKDQASVPIIIKAIENPEYKDILIFIIAACWKNGLKFNDYIASFIDVFIQSEFLLAFEAFTVIDNFEYIDPKLANVCLLRLESSVEEITEDKRALYNELIIILENINKNPAN